MRAADIRAAIIRALDEEVECEDLGGCEDEEDHRQIGDSTPPIGGQTPPILPCNSGLIRIGSCCRSLKLELWMWGWHRRWTPSWSDRKHRSRQS
jgi:hypothetical protein